MKAVVVELRDGKAAVLLGDGRVELVANRGYAVGQELALRPARHTPAKRLATAASAAAVLLLLGGGIIYALPEAYVSLDVNPSIEYTVNRFDRVLGVRPVNEDGEAIVASLAHTRNATIGEVLTQSVTALSASHYLDGEDDTVLLLSVASGSAARSESLAQELTATARAATGDAPAVRVECVTGSRQDARTAQELGVTLGKKTVVDELQSGMEADEQTYQQWLHQPVQEILRQLEQQSGDDDENHPNHTAGATATAGGDKTPHPSATAKPTNGGGRQDANHSKPSKPTPTPRSKPPKDDQSDNSQGGNDKGSGQDDNDKGNDDRGGGKGDNDKGNDDQGSGKGDDDRGNDDQDDGQGDSDKGDDDQSGGQNDDDKGSDDRGDGQNDKGNGDRDNGQNDKGNDN